MRVERPQGAGEYWPDSEISHGALVILHTSWGPDLRGRFEFIGSDQSIYEWEARGPMIYLSSPDSEGERLEFPAGAVLAYTVL